MAGGKIDEKFNSRVFINPGDAKNLFSDFCGLYKTKYRSAKELGISPQAFDNYLNAVPKSYPRQIIDAVCTALSRDSSEITMAKTDLAVIRGDKNRHKKLPEERKFKDENIDSLTPEQRRERTKAMRQTFNEKFGEQGHKTIGGLSALERKCRTKLYDFAFEIFSVLSEKQLTLYEILTKSNIPEKHKKFIVSEMLADSLIKKQGSFYTSASDSFVWQETIDDLFSTIDKPYEQNELAEKTGITNEKLKVFLYKLKSQGKLNEQFDSRKTIWFKPEHKDSPLLLGSIPRSVLRYLLSHKNATNIKLRTDLSVEKKALIYHLNKLIESGLISRTQNKREFFYNLGSASEEEIFAELFHCSETPLYRESIEKLILTRAFGSEYADAFDALLANNGKVVSASRLEPLKRLSDFEICTLDKKESGFVFSLSRARTGYFKYWLDKNINEYSALKKQCIASEDYRKAGFFSKVLEKLEFIEKCY